MTENVNGTSKTGFDSDEDPQNIQRTASNEKALISEIPN